MDDVRSRRAARHLLRRCGPPRPVGWGGGGRRMVRDLSRCGCPRRCMDCPVVWVHRLCMAAGCSQRTLGYHSKPADPLGGGRRHWISGGPSRPSRRGQASGYGWLSIPHLAPGACRQPSREQMWCCTRRAPSSAPQTTTSWRQPWRRARPTWTSATTPPTQRGESRQRQLDGS